MFAVDVSNWMLARRVFVVFFLGEPVQGIRSIGKCIEHFSSEAQQKGADTK